MYVSNQLLHCFLQRLFILLTFLLFGRISSIHLLPSLKQKARPPLPFSFLPQTWSVTDTCQSDGLHFTHDEGTLSTCVLLYASCNRCSRDSYWWTSLVVQWVRTCLPMQGTWVWSLVPEDSTCRGATKAHVPQLLSLRAATTEVRVPKACALQQEKPLQWEASAPQWGVAPTLHSWRKPACSNEDPVQAKINNK